MTKKWNTHYLFRHILLLLFTISLCSTALGVEFVHPGISHNSSELEFIKAKLKAKMQPWQEAWDQLRDSSYAKLSWKPRPVANVERGAYNRPDIGGTFFLSDGTAAYTHALIWWFTREEAHAAKATDILNAWSGTLKSIGNHDARLLVGMGGINYCNAAELLKHTWGKWPKKDQDAFRTMLRQILYPVIEDFYPTANGNWDASMIQTMMAMGIHLDDLSMFQKAVDYFLEGEGNGAVNHYFNHFGQCQESGRDQAHTQMGLEYLVNSSEIAWKQGIDIYGAYDNRLAKGFEYTARYNLGEDVAFEYYESYRGRYKHHEISNKSRGRLRAMYEKAYNHYHNRMGMDMPWCKKAIEKTRPERGGVSSLPWSTLMYANQPAGLVKLERSSQSLSVAQELRNNANPSQESDRLGKIKVLKKGDATIHTYMAPEESHLVTSHIIETQNKLVIVDVQFFRPYAKELKQYISQLEKPVERVIISHAHPDHWFGLEYFQDVPVYATQETADWIDRRANFYIRIRRGQYGEKVTESKIIPPHRIKKGREIIDGLVYEFENIKDGEHIDQLIIKLPELKTIIVQDLVSNHAHAFVGGGRLDEWIKILERLAAMENYDAVLVGHGGPAKRSVYGQMIEYLSHAKSVLAASTGGEQITKGLIDKYPDHGARTLAELSGWFTDFMRRRQ